MNRSLNSYILTGCILLTAAMAGCKKDKDLGHADGQPVTIADFTPTTGGAQTEILITGDNFSPDTANIRVTVNGKRCTVIGANTKQIMVVVPKRCGSGTLTVAIGKDSVKSSTPFNYIFTRTVTTFAGNGKAGYADGKGTDAAFSFNSQAWYRSMGIATDNNGNVYVADPGNSCVRKIDPAGNVSVLAGSPGNYGYADGKGAAARFAAPYGLATDDAGNVYTADPINYDIRKITPDGTATTIGFGKGAPWSIAVDKTTGDVYYGVCDVNGSVYRLKDQQAIVSGYVYPAGIGFDKAGNLYVSGNGEHVISQFKAGSWTRTNIAGQLNNSGYVNGAGSVAKFAYPWGLALDSDGNIYVAGNGTWDGGASNPDQSIRMISAGTWNVSTYAGSGTSGYADGKGEAAAFAGPGGVTVDKNGVVYVIDKNNNRVRKIVSE